MNNNHVRELALKEIDIQMQYLKEELAQAWEQPCTCADSTCKSCNDIIALVKTIDILSEDTCID